MKTDTFTIEERFGPNLYAFLKNDGVNHIDSLGLMKYAEIEEMRKHAESEVSKECCKCSSPGIKLYIDLTGFATGTAITGLAIPRHERGCVYKIKYFFWTCYDSWAENANQNRGPGAFASREVGWTEVSHNTFTKNYSPGAWVGYALGVAPQPIDPGNGRQVAMEAAAFAIVCGNDGHKHAIKVPVLQELVFYWSRLHRDWENDPAVNPDMHQK